MSSILLGPLAQKNNLDSIYNSNISDKMNEIERIQATKKYSNVEFLNQFDDLRFDNISVPVGINEAFTTSKGLDPSLQRNLDFTNGYSQFAHNDMHYDVVDTHQFTHNNMIPNTTKRDFDINSDRTQRKLETFTGNFEHYTFKKEKHHLFEPMADLTYINGMPSITNVIDNRFIPSNKNNYGNTPFQTNVKVRPGIDKDNQEGNYSVYRILPKNIDVLRSDTNQKISYNSITNEAIKKGEIRGPDPNITKFKMPDFRETHFDDLLPSKSQVDGPKQIGNYTNVTSMRNEQEHYNPGHAVNTSIGSGPNKNKTNFSESKKENYLNDNSHSVGSVYIKPVMTNAKSYTAYENQRFTTNINYEAPVMSNQSGYTVDYKDVPLTTVRELMIYNDNILGANSEQKSYVFSNDMILPITNRQTNSHSIVTNPINTVKQHMIYNNDQVKTTNRQTNSHNIVSNAVGEIKQAKTYNEDQAKPTIRQTNFHNLVSNAVGEIKQAKTYNEDQAKPTIRQTNFHNLVSNAVGENKQAKIYNEDQAKPTIRQTNFHNLVSNAVGENKQAKIYNEDQAKPTIRQSNFHNLVSNAVGKVNQTKTYNEDLAKPTIRQTTLINNHNGILSNVNNESTYVRDLYDRAKITIREQTEDTVHITHAKANNNEGTYVRDLYEKAKTTTREQIEDTVHITHAKANNNEGTYVRDLNDKAKMTIRQQTENTEHITHAKANNNEGTYVRDLNDKAKITIKETTIVSTPGGGVNNTNMGNYTNLMDDMRTTIKETTHLENYEGAKHGEIEAPISHEASKNMCIDDRREISTYNRTPNGKGDLNGPYIDRDNVKLNEPILFSYVPHPHKTLDHSVMPTTSRETIEKIYSMSKPVIETSSYYVNPYFINTLKNNPLVNDIYHQKNV